MPTCTQHFKSSFFFSPKISKKYLEVSNLFQNREFSYETEDLKNINVMLNSNDVSEYLKISADGLEVGHIDLYMYLGQKKNMCVYCHMLKKIRVGRSEIIFF